ncbi:WD domain, G-beta repeat [Teratosphaeria destructans]|uniref:WD domain, G-beta repeat n=1 Tax=Teratosphaeria destructans TaxID=418781 RepID=A0A9W7W3R7_9PEZI|nr:WD domain, G-beta repeat [Teratosphaeria destructans]
MADAPMAPVSKVNDIISSFRPTKLFKPSSSMPTPSYTSIDFDDSGEFLLLSRTDDTIQLYNTKAGAHAKEMKSQKYGSALARFSHQSTSIIYASTKGNHDIRYLSMHDNTFIRYFKGHEDRVTSLCISPSGDQFMSASLDNTVKLWDMRTPNPTGQLEFETAYLCAYDPSATVLAVASPPAQNIFLYDLKNYDKPPFATFDLHDIEKRFVNLGQRPATGWTGIEFSNHGKYVLVTTNGPGHYLVDAYNGELVHYLHRPTVTSPLRPAPGDEQGQSQAICQADAVFSPDGRYVVGGNGSSNGLVVWDAEDKGKKDGVLEPSLDLPATKSVSVVAYNPRFNLLATANKEVMMWLPDPDAA